MTTPLASSMLTLSECKVCIAIYIVDKNLFEQGENRLFTREVELVSTPIPCQKWWTTESHTTIHRIKIWWIIRNDLVTGNKSLMLFFFTMPASGVFATSVATCLLSKSGVVSCIFSRKDEWKLQATKNIIWGFFEKQRKSIRFNDRRQD